MGQYGPLPNDPGDYGTRRAAKTAERRAQQRGEVVEHTKGREVERAEVDTDDMHPAAVEFWKLVHQDESRDRWGSGDHALAVLTLRFIDDVFTKASRPKARPVSAEAFRAIQEALTQLQATDSAKRRLSWIVDRERQPDDEFGTMLAEVFALDDESIS